jgi:hypothetical protein
MSDRALRELRSLPLFQVCYSAKTILPQHVYFLYSIGHELSCPVATRARAVCRPSAAYVQTTYVQVTLVSSIDYDF